MRSASAATAAVVLALALAPALALAQEQTSACRAPVLSVQPVPDAFEPGSSTTILFAVQNDNQQPPVDAVRATVTTTAPAGWSATPAQREMTLAPRGQQLVPLAITAPNRGSGQPAGNITLTVLFVCTSGDIQTSASTSAAIAVQIVQFEAPWSLVLAGFLVLAAGVAVLGYRRFRRGVALWPLTPERSVEPGKSAKFTFNVENRRGKPQRFRVETTGAPEGWSVHRALDELELEPGEEKTLWIILRAPPGAALDELVELHLRLVSERETIEARSRARVASEA
jgi:uncharacterized membrane protein